MKRRKFYESLTFCFNAVEIRQASFHGLIKKNKTLEYHQRTTREYFPRAVPGPHMNVLSASLRRILLSFVAS